MFFMLLMFQAVDRISLGITGKPFTKIGVWGSDGSSCGCSAANTLIPEDDEKAWW